MRILELPEGQSLSLANEGGLEAFFIGVGSMFATRHFQTNFLIVKGNDHVLVDFGMTGPAALAQTARIHPAKIHVVAVSHGHDDHIGGLGYLGLLNRYVGMPFMSQPKLKLVVPEPFESVLWEQSLRGGLEWNETDNTGRRMTLADYFDVIHPVPTEFTDRETYVTNVGDIKLEFFRTRHIPQQAESIADSFISYGVFVDDRIFFSCDTQFDRPLLDSYALRGAEFFFHDVQFFPGAVHAPLEDLRTLPSEIKERTFLKHYGDNWEEQDITGFAGWTRQGVRYCFD